MDMTHPSLLHGVGFDMAGNADAFLVEGSEIARFDSAAQAWVREGDVIDVSGSTPNCLWDQSTGRCA